ncbi:nuclear protein DGCR14 [Ampelomyces quisqualis]|uniref:Nuclear protein DGCR14 n=1 Tax=Ampelomyces quisqualis TaxID=50730 RepID=A0A6A5QRR9_AMPQU|nr:nuclear protein DGCR14 [Ampelomyces quisqualis]
MFSSNSTALTKRNASSALMEPPPVPKRIKRPLVVLDEDTYVSAVSHIIRRDFFPGLAEADAQQEYLNAVESKDKAWIREAGKKLTHVMTPVPSGRRRTAERTRFDRLGGIIDQTPSVWAADTPVSVATLEAEKDDEGLGKLDKVDLDMNLGAFQAKYTSEDQESFNQIIDKQNEKRFQKNAWLREGNMYASKQRIAQRKVIQARAAANESKQLVTTTRPSQNLDDRPAAPTGTKHVGFNSFMFAPDSVESWAPTRAQAAQSASLAPPKQILYNNTRLAAPVEPCTERPPSPTLSSIRAAVAGNPRLNPSEAGFTGADTPRVNGYAFVDAHPPSDDDQDDAPTDLLSRYGLDNASRATPFCLTESSAREKMHYKMVERIGAKRSDGSANNSGTKPGLGIFTSETPRFMSAPTPRAGALQTPGRKAKGDLTPAAQRLFERVGRGPRTGEGSGGFGNAGKGAGSGSALGREWTPTPRVKRRA